MDAFKLVARVIATLVCAVLLSQVALLAVLPALALMQVEETPRTLSVVQVVLSVLIAGIGLSAQYRYAKRVRSARQPA